MRSKCQVSAENLSATSFPDTETILVAFYWQLDISRNRTGVQVKVNNVPLFAQSVGLDLPFSLDLQFTFVFSMSLVGETLRRDVDAM